MEGVTDDPYRNAIFQLFDEWDYYFTDFYRIPTVGKVSEKAIQKHIGFKSLNNSKLLKKTCFQILTSAKAQNEKAVSIIENFGFHHLDLNLGCPSKKVNAHKGGAYLLKDLKTLEDVLKSIRTNFSKTFTVKIRIGYHDDKLFFDLLKLFEDCGVEAITIHARTRDQLYQGVADWEYIKKAVEFSNLPIIGNGDVWTVHDVERIFEECNPYAVMLGRGALKTPWLATQYYQYKENLDFISDEYLLKERKEYIESYFKTLEKEYMENNPNDLAVLKRFKSYSRYLFDDYEDCDAIKSRLLRSTSLNEFKGHLNSLI